MPQSDSPSPISRNGSGLELDFDNSVRTATGISPDVAPTPQPLGRASSGLALDSYAPLPEVVRGRDPLGRAQAVAVSDIAKFGTPEPGLVGAIKYWLTVRRRLRELAPELVLAEEKRRVDADARIRHLSELGRSGHAAQVTNDSLDPLYSKAMLAQGELKGQERKRNSRSQDHRTKVASLAAAIELIEKKIAPTKEEEASCKAQKQELEQARRNIETRLKRVEIDLRNMDDLIKQRQESYADLKKPKEERQQLLDEISNFDRRRPGLIEQVDRLTQELCEVKSPLGDVEAKLAALHDILAPEIQKTMALAMEIESVNRAFAAEDEVVVKKLGEEVRNVEELWAVAGERLVRERLDPSALSELRSQAEASMVAAAESERQHALLTQAIGGFDREVVKKAKTIALGAAGGLVLIIILLVIIL